MLPCPWCTGGMTPAFQENRPASMWMAPSESWGVQGSPSTARCPPPCVPQRPDPRDHSSLFPLSISLDISKASLQKLQTSPCLHFTSLFSNAGFPTSFSTSFQQQWLEIPTRSIPAPEDLKEQGSVPGSQGCRVITRQFCSKDDTFPHRRPFFDPHRSPGYLKCNHILCHFRNRLLSTIYRLICYTYNLVLKYTRIL